MIELYLCSDKPFLYATDGFFLEKSPEGERRREKTCILLPSTAADKITAILLFVSQITCFKDNFGRFHFSFETTYISLKLLLFISIVFFQN